MPSSHVILCHPLLLLPPIPPSIRVLSNESTLRMRWPKYWSFSFSISPSNEHPGLISFRMDWLDLLAVPRDSQESSPTPQFKTFNSSLLTILYAPTVASIHDNRKQHSFDLLNFFSKVMPLLLKTLLDLLAFLQTSKHHLISWLQSSSAVILEPPKIKSLIVSIVFPSICHEVMGRNVMIFIFF